MHRMLVLTVATSLALGLVNCSHCDDPCMCGNIFCTTGILEIDGPLHAPPTVTAITSTNAYVIDFGPVALGVESAGALKLTDTGNSPLQILSVGMPTDPEFGLTLVAGTSIQPGSTMDVPFSFKPFSAGGKLATVVIQTDSTATPTVRLNLGGLGVMAKLEVSPSDVDFGNVVVHTSPTITITVTNDSSADTVVTPGPIQGADASLFTLDAAPGTPIAIPANSAIPLRATFSPLVGSTSPSNAYFVLSSSLGQSITVDLRGIVLQSGLCVSPNPLSFTFVQPGSAVTLPLHISACGDTSVTITSLSIMETDGSAPCSAPPVSTSLSPGQVIDVPVTCTPTGPGPYSTELDIVTNFGTLVIPLSW